LPEFFFFFLIGRGSALSKPECPGEAVSPVMISFR
jgi:hypothetical protein